MTRYCRARSTSVAVSLATPNGVKVTVMLLAAGHKGAEYDAWLIQIGEGISLAVVLSELTPTPKYRR